MNKNSIAFGTPGIEPRWTSSNYQRYTASYQSAGLKRHERSANDGPPCFYLMRACAVLPMHERAN